MERPRWKEVLFGSFIDNLIRESGDIDEPTRAALLRTIVDESSRLNDIIANLVFATRLESGSVDLRREWTTVEEIVGAGLSRHRDALATRPFRVHVPADLPMIRVDNAMLPQVVHNPVENALRYTAPGTPLGVSAWTIETNVVVKVWDDGAGLADDESSKVFERFYRGRASKTAGSNSHAATSTGMGLGLTICEGIVRVHGGRIWAEPNTPRVSRSSSRFRSTTRSPCFQPRRTRQRTGAWPTCRGQQTLG